MGRHSNRKWAKRAQLYVDAPFTEKDRIVALFRHARKFWRALGGR